MTNIDEAAKAELAREIALTLAKKQRLAFASDFHAFAEDKHLTLAGVTFENFPKGPNTKRSDGDVVAHAIVMALAAAVNKGDIDDWFPDKGETGIKSIDYLPEMRSRLIEPEHLLLGTIDLKAPRAKAAGVLSGPSTLPAVPDERGRLALVWVHADCEADGLRLWQGQSFEARSAPLSPVALPVRVRPAASSPKLPSE